MSTEKDYALYQYLTVYGILYDKIDIYKLENNDGFIQYRGCLLT